MKRIVSWMSVVVFCAVFALCCVACAGESTTPIDAQPDAQTEDKQPEEGQAATVSVAQQRMNQTVAEVSMITHQCAFANGDEAILQSAAGEADDYVICRDEEGESLVYVYHDVCYDASRNYRYFEAYMPTSRDKLDPATPVFLYLHGGGWMAGNRRDESESLMPCLARTGQVVISMEYALWFGLNQKDDSKKGIYSWRDVNADVVYNAVMKNEKAVSIDDMMEDITVCLTYLRDTYLPSLKLTATNIGLGGYSAGGHLSSLYAYKHADISPIPIAYLLDLAGPVSIADSNYIYLLDLISGRVKDMFGDVDESFAPFWKQLEQAAPALAGILGVKDPVNVRTEEGYQILRQKVEEYQAVSYVTAATVPTILCYSTYHDEEGYLAAFWDCEFDNLVPITVYETILAKLTEAGVVHTEKVFDNLTHNDMGSNQATCAWMAQQVTAFSRVYSR